MAVTVLQRIASEQQIGFLLVPAIKGAVYINTYSNYSQPVLTKLYNKNIGGHLYTFTTYWQYHQCISAFYAPCNVSARK